ncbi:UDP-N-acetylglucosamine 4,6-dehydratase (inverting) [Pseudarthrobacter sp. NIBRBAC000502771]|uniref:UDP-N-acetylglucosamine 4,6-dehydratase (inverting) n=1 Tax=Pseudarthrobacter sp. NIBRBAC000502771 TaxID=2590774 RepID=UPI001FEE5474|nr:UDP-N-acetylglucosamine 4,6-dehydratase (inverting) [Pseudarthrobacter sp. NIBRBAC000502771]
MARGSRSGGKLNTLAGSSVLITGGTGSLGKALIRELLDNHSVRRLVVFSRDELKQLEVRRMFDDDPRLRWFIGDIRDRKRLDRALHNVDYVVHAAALKQVDTAEYNPFEYVETNVRGSQNVIDACIDAGVKKVVALSTDKASSPINLYGATKLCADRMFISANHYAASYPTRFSVVRYGNVMGSRGSIVPIWKQLAAEGRSLPITDSRMTRFWITLPKAVDFVLDSFDMMTGGELYVPRIPSMRVVDLAEAIAPGAATHEIGIRPGEKLHEEMIALDDARRTLLMDTRYVVTPHLSGWGYTPPADAMQMPDGFSFQSHTNDQWLDVDQLRDLVTEEEMAGR